MNTEELPKARPQVNEQADDLIEQFDDLLLSNLNNNFGFRPASEFDNFLLF